MRDEIEHVSTHVRGDEERGGGGGVERGVGEQGPDLSPALMNGSRSDFILPVINFQGLSK